MGLEVKGNPPQVGGEAQGAPAADLNVSPATGSEEQQGEEKFKVLGQEFHNKEHFERVMSKELQEYSTLKAERAAEQQARAEQERDATLISNFKAQNPGLDDNAIREQVEATKKMYSNMFSEEKNMLNQQIGSIAFNNYVQNENIDEDVAGDISAVYSIPEIANLVNNRNANGESVLSFNDLRNWAEAPELRNKVAQLEQQISALTGGNVAAGASSSGAVNVQTNNAGDPPLGNYEAMKKWKEANIVR